MAIIDVAKPISTSRQVLLNIYWFSINMIWASVLLIIMPRHIQRVIGDSAEIMVLGLVLAIGAVVSMLFAPIFGAFSDRIPLPGGRRKPWMVIGSFGVILSLAGLSYWTYPEDISSLPGWVAAFIALEFFSTIATAPCSALIPDQVPTRQRGSAAGWLGLMSMLGYFAGGLTGLLIEPWGIGWVYTLMMVLLLIGMLVVVFGVDESNLSRETPRFSTREFLIGLYLPFKNADFSRVFFNRLLVGMGTFTVQEFLVFYMADAFEKPYTLPILGKVADTPQEAVSVFLPALFLGSIATTLFAGMLSDRYGRKRIAYAAALILGVTCAIFTFSHSFALSVLVGIVFGLGFGAYESVNWALAADVLPSAHDHGKDMGIWHITLVLSRLLATPVAGFLLNHFQPDGAAHNTPQTGYIIIFVIAVVYFMLASICIKQIEGIR